MISFWECSGWYGHKPCTRMTVQKSKWIRPTTTEIWLLELFILLYNQFENAAINAAVRCKCCCSHLSYATHGNWLKPEFSFRWSSTILCSLPILSKVIKPCRGKMFMKIIKIAGNGTQLWMNKTRLSLKYKYASTSQSW